MHVSKQSEIFHALQFNLTGWLIDLDAALKIFFHFKLKAETLRLHTSKSLSIDLIHTFLETNHSDS